MRYLNLIDTSSLFMRYLNARLDTSSLFMTLVAAYITTEALSMGQVAASFKGLAAVTYRGAVIITLGLNRLDTSVSVSNLYLDLVMNNIL